MKISIFGLGYVGVVSAACLAKAKHTIVGVDVSQTKVDQINFGKAPIIEAQLDELLASAAQSGLISATTDAVKAIAETELSLVCVGTPSQPNGNLDISAIKKVCSEIGHAIAQKGTFHTVVIRSTVLPGTVKNVVLPILEEATKGKLNTNFGLAHNPEFLREGVAVKDFFNPPKTVIGTSDETTAGIIAKLYDGITAPMVVTSIEVSEMVKYVDNVWHGLKVCFGNEVGNICHALNIDSHEVMDIFCKDTKLNLSPYYLKPGFAFGGSCLPKDTRALFYKARELDLDVPVIQSINPSNQRQIERAVKMITSQGKKKISVLGFTFKAGTDDLRESPLVEVIERLLGKGYELKLYDANVSLAALIGANKEYILKTIPHISNLLTSSIEQALKDAEVIIIGNDAQEFRNVPKLLKENQILMDFVRLPNIADLGERYHGINWGNPRA